MRISKSPLNLFEVFEEKLSSIIDKIIEYISDGEKFSEKISSVRFYSGEKFRTEKLAETGDICAVTGLEHTYSGHNANNLRKLTKVLKSK